MTSETKLTMRDEFAMSALSALCGGSWNGSPVNFIFEDKYNLVHKFAVAAYKIADEMLYVRESDECE